MEGWKLPAVPWIVTEVPYTGEKQALKRRSEEQTDTASKRPHLEFDTFNSGQEDMNAKGIINDWKQKYGNDIEYRLDAESGPDHKKTFTVSLVVDGQIKGYGTGPTIKAAEQEAAVDGLDRLGITNSQRTSLVHEDPKSKLNELLQKHHLSLIFKLFGKTGPDHRPTFSVQLFINNKPLAVGNASNKRDAERCAAALVLRKIENGTICLQDKSSEVILGKAKDSKCTLNDWIQSRRKSIRYVESNRYGADHALSFEVDLYIDGHKKTSGSGTSITKAEQEAAKKAIQQIFKEVDMSYPKMNSPRFPLLSLYDELANITHKAFEAVTHNVIVSIGSETVVAAIIMEESDRRTVLSIGSGNVFIDEECLSRNGETVIDSHAEVIARRGFQRVLLNEVYKLQKNISGRLGILTVQPNGQIVLKPNIKFHLYISKSPCGDGSIFTLNNRGSPLESGKLHSPVFESKQGQLRAKVAKGEGAIFVEDLQEGRFHKMSCSDKICKWNVLGLQGALLSNFIDNPIYLSTLVVGDVYNFKHLSRALCCRVKRQNSPPDCNNVTVVHPDIGMSSIYDTPELGKSKSVSVNWNIVDGSVEVTDGRDGKICPEQYLLQPTNPDCSSRICKKHMFKLYKKLDCRPETARSTTLNIHHIMYSDIKRLATRYQAKKKMLYNYFREKGYGTWKERNVDDFC